MKKRFLSIFLSISMLMSAMPVRVSAEYTVNGYDDVVKLEKWGYGYMIYTVNGHRYDSRDRNVKVNAAAYIALSKEDKDKLIGCFYDKKQKEAQFGEECGNLISAHNRNSTGMCKIAEAFAQSIEKKCLTQYHEVFGSEKDAPNYWYEKTVSDMMIFDVDTPAQIILTQYINTPKGQIFGQKYCEMEINMRIAKKQYDEMMNIYNEMMHVADKAVLWDGFKLVVESAVYPGPSESLSSIISDGFWCTLDYIDYTTEYLGTKYFNYDTEGTVTDLKNQILGTQSVKAGSGNAAKIIKKLRPLADARQKALEQAYNTAKQTREQLIAEAPSVLEDIKKDIAAEEYKAQEKAAFAQMEQDRKRDAAQAAVDNTTPNTAKYQYIKNLEPTGNETSEVYQQQLEKYRQACAAAEEALAERYRVWQADTEAAYAKVIKDAGFDYDEPIDGVYYYKRYQCDPESIWNYLDLKYTSNTEYYDWVTEDNKKDIKAEAKNFCDYCDNAANKIGSFYADLNTMLTEREKALRGILEDSEGFDKTSYAGLYNAYYNSGVMVLQNMAVIKANCSDFDGEVPVSAETAKEAAQAQKALVQENYDILMANYAKYREELREYLEEYLNIQSSFYLTWAEYTNTIAAMKDLVDNKMPDYVHDQAVTGYAAIGAGDKPTIYFTGGEYLSSTDNQILRDKIAAAEKTTAGSHYFFKTEAQKLRELLDEYDRLENNKNALYTWAEDHKNGLSSLNKKLIDADYLKARGIEPREFKTQSEIADETNIYRDEDYYKYRLNFDQLEDIAAAMALCKDFKGCSFSHTQFMENMAKRQLEFGNTARMIKRGELGYADFINNYSSHLWDMINRFKKYNMYSYSGPYANIGDPDEISFEETVFGDDGYITKLNRLYDELYIPVERIGKDDLKTMSDGGEIMLEEGGTAKLSAVVEPENATFKNIKWQSLDPDIVSVDNDGNITALSGGTATVVAIAEDSEVTQNTETVNGEQRTVYIYGDNYVLTYTVNVGELPYKEISALDPEQYGSEEQQLVTYSFRNYGTDSEPRYYETTNGGRTVTVQYRPSAGSTETMQLELYGADGSLLASQKCSNADYDRAAMILSATADKAADKIKVSLYLDEECTELEKVFFEVSTGGEEKVFIFGDADADNVVTASDAALILQKTLTESSVMPIQKETENWMKYIDVDCDKYITASDAALVLQKTLIESSEFPAEKN